MPLDSASTRDPRGRFQPGRSGNPAGKKPGTLNHATVFKASLRDGEAHIAARRVIDAAVAGNLSACKFLIAQVDGKPRGRPIPFELPGDAGPADLLAASAAAFEGMAAGAISPDEALLIARFLRERVRLMDDLAPRVSEAAPADLHPPSISSDSSPAAPPAAAPAEAPADLHSPSISQAANTPLPNLAAQGGKEPGLSRGTIVAVPACEEGSGRGVSGRASNAEPPALSSTRRRGDDGGCVGATDGGRLGASV